MMDDKPSMEKARKRSIDDYEFTMQLARTLLAKSVHPLAKPFDPSKPLFPAEADSTSESSHSKQAASYLRVMTRLQIGEDRMRYRQMHGGNFDPKESRNVDAIAAQFAPSEWTRLIGIFASLLEHYADRVVKPRAIMRNARKTVSQCRALATLLETFDASSLSAWAPEDGPGASTFHGMVARHVLHRYWVQALEALRSAVHPAVAQDIAQHCVWNLVLTPPEKLLTGLLRDYANKVENFKLGTATSLLNNPLFTRGKLTEKEFVKRMVFFLLHGLAPKTRRRAPNKETAIVANIILGLSGRSAVTANEVCQMNKSTRRQYYKEYADFAKESGWSG